MSVLEELPVYIEMYPMSDPPPPLNRTRTYKSKLGRKLITYPIAKCNPRSLLLIQLLLHELPCGRKWPISSTHIYSIGIYNIYPLLKGVDNVSISLSESGEYKVNQSLLRSGFDFLRPASHCERDIGRICEAGCGRAILSNPKNRFPCGTVTLNRR